MRTETNGAERSVRDNHERKPSSFWRDQPVLVTGATGLLGGWLTGTLVERGADVVCVVRDWVPESILLKEMRDEVHLVRGDVRDRDLMERTLAEYEVATVFHLAAQTTVPVATRNPVATLDTNIRGTWTVLDACRTSPTTSQVIVASSDKAYAGDETLPFSEDARLHGCAPYEVSKSCTDLIAQMYAHHYGLGVVVTRCGNLYGGGDLNWNRLIPGTIRSIFNGEPPIVRSDGSPLRDYLHVLDGCAAYLLCAEALHEEPGLAGQAFNFSCGEPRSVLEVVQLLLDTANSPLQPRILGEGRGEIQSQYLDATKARRQLGWRPMFDIREGLRQTMEWYERFLAAG